MPPNAAVKVCQSFLFAPIVIISEKNIIAKIRPTKLPSAIKTDLSIGLNEENAAIEPAIIAIKNATADIIPARIRSGVLKSETFLLCVNKSSQVNAITKVDINDPIANNIAAIPQISKECPCAFPVIF